MKTGLNLITKLGGVVSANVNKATQVKDGFRGRGRYDVENHLPFSMNNPSKVNGLLERHAKYLRQWSSMVASRRDNNRIPMQHLDDIMRRGLLPFSAVQRLARTIGRSNPDLFHEIRGLIHGGDLKWEYGFPNLVLNGGLDHALDIVLSGGTQDTSWFVGLLAASPSPLATWTATELASNDFVNYDEATLQAFVDGGVSSQSLDNSASTADFTISTNGSSIGGAFLIGTNAKATPAGTAYSAGAFSGGNKAADDNDTLSVTYTFTAADDGA